MLSRVQNIFRRYGWRTPWVVSSIAVARTSTIRERIFLNRLKLTTKGTKGKNISFGQGVVVSPGADLTLGDNLYIGARCFFEISANPSGRVIIGSNTWVSHDCHICSWKSICIGEHVLIGEFVSIRDTSHSYSDTTLPIKTQADVIGHITIEDGVWIGRGCLIQGKPDGITIGRGAIVAANSVVSRSIPSMEVWGGVPAHFIKQR